MLTFVAHSYFYNNKNEQISSPLTQFSAPTILIPPLPHHLYTTSIAFKLYTIQIVLVPPLPLPKTQKSQNCSKIIPKIFNCPIVQTVSIRLNLKFPNCFKILILLKLFQNPYIIQTVPNSFILIKTVLILLTQKAPNFFNPPLTEISKTVPKSLY